MKSLVLWSGGTDSTALLKWLLSETDNDIVAVHIYAPNSVKRAEQEWNAVKIFNTHFQSIRPYELHRVDIHIPWDTIDADVHMTILPALINGSKCDNFFRGMCGEDWTEAVRIRHARYYGHILNWMKPKWDTIQAMSPDLPIKHYTKKQLIQYLSPMGHLTWSCLHPVNGVQCGECRSCILRR